MRTEQTMNTGSSTAPVAAQRLNEVVMSNNAAAMRDALMKCADLISNVMTGELAIGPVETIEEIDRIISKALSAPARNCDKYTSESDAKRAFLDYRNWLCGSDYDLGDLKHNIDGITEEYAEWLLASAEKGETE